MADQVLKSAKITFIMPEGDDKDDNTAVTVAVSTKFNNQFDLTLASKVNFANNDTWEDTGDKSYTYALDFSPVSLSQISNEVKTHIHISPNGNDTVKFGYLLSLIFDDGDPNTAVAELTQRRDNITLSQDNRDFSS
ncbi:hypothetical protein [Spirosoma sp.]|uniref:hypothetical protein n=1 Tax=Spirosoma sp. TaxID=1899569 RepID=UPI00260714D4|nr:hypothetical protein [Spirosoma sp.]MCX6213817.1 hypothetical protein [Spirosoma sp.]